MTVADVARGSEVTERTVRRDIASGILPARKLKGGRLSIHKRDYDRYRSHNRLQGRSWPIDEYAQILGVSLRTMRRWIGDGKIKAVRVSARRTRITDAEHGRVFVLPIEALAGFFRRCRRHRTHAKSTARTRRRPQAATGDDTTEADGLELPLLVTVAELARLSQKAVPQTHRLLKKLQIRTFRWGGPKSKILIRWDDARDYLLPLTMRTPV